MPSSDFGERCWVCLAAAWLESSRVARRFLFLISSGRAALREVPSCVPPVAAGHANPQLVEAMSLLENKLKWRKPLGLFP